MLTIQKMGWNLDFYFKIYKIGAAHIELSTLYTLKPLLSINRWDKEIIIDGPGLRVILTPWARLVSEVNGRDHGTNFCGSGGEPP